jgi:hypothetical protein
MAVFHSIINGNDSSDLDKYEDKTLSLYSVDHEANVMFADRNLNDNSQVFGPIHIYNSVARVNSPKDQYWYYAFLWEYFNPADNSKGTAYVGLQVYDAKNIVKIEIKTLDKSTNISYQAHFSKREDLLDLINKCKSINSTKQ